MKAQDLVNNGTVTVEDLMNHTDKTRNWKQIQQKLNEATGFKKAIPDVDTSDTYTIEDVLNADVIEIYYLDEFING